MQLFVYIIFVIRIYSDIHLYCFLDTNIFGYWFTSKSHIHQGPRKSVSNNKNLDNSKDKSEEGKCVKLSRRVPVGKTTFTVDWFIGTPKYFIPPRVATHPRSTLLN